MALLTLGLALAAAPACSDTRAPAPAAASDAPASTLGSIQVGLVLPQNIEIDSVAYKITRGTFSQTGALDVSNTNTIAGTIGGLPVGTGYQVALTATDTTHKLSGCAGSATFDVTAAAVTPVPIDVTCHVAPATTPPSVPVPFPAVAVLGGALLGAGLLASGVRRR